MRMEAHISVVPARVRESELAQHGAVRLDSGRVYAVASASGWPRLWGLAGGAALEGFEAGLKDAGSARGADRLQRAIEGAATQLAAMSAALIEREPIDVALLGVLVDGGELHVHRAGSPRAYLHRKGHTDRLTPRNEPLDGLSGMARYKGSVLLDPGDLVFLGSASAFSSPAIAKVTSVLTEDASAPPSVLAALMTEPAYKAGVGASAIVLRAI